MSGTGPPYPDRFFLASKYAAAPEHNGPKLQLGDDLRLLLYALYQQATEGPCTEPKPWGWEVIKSAKWTSWNKLGNMAKMEAMRLYVRTIEEEGNPEWWKDLGSDPDEENGESAPKEETAVAEDVFGGAVVDSDESAEANQWRLLVVSGKPPSARYQHDMCILGNNAYVVAGNSGGRHLSDMAVLDFEKMLWRSSKDMVERAPANGNGDADGSSLESLPPTTGHKLVVYKHKIYLIGGLTKTSEEAIAVRVLDTGSLKWKTLPTTGPLPCARGGHSATLVGTKLVVFGGQDRKRRVMSDLYALNMETLVWEAPPATGTGPAIRCDHTATCHRNAFVYIFGGGSHSHCFNDVFKLDVATWKWSKVECSGQAPAPRAGHASTRLGARWFIAGGGDNAKGLSDTYCLNMDENRWNPLASGDGCSDKVGLEGLTLMALPRSAVSGNVDTSDGLLVAFGGYNGHYSNKVHILRISLQDAICTQPAQTSTATKTSKVASTKPSPTTSATPESKRLKEADERIKALESSLKTMVEEADASSKKAGLSEAKVNELQENARKLDDEKKLLADKLEEAAKRLMAAESELDAAKAALQAEQDKVMTMEVKLAEAAQQRQALEMMEKELGLLRRKTQEMEERSRASGQGIWGYISGAQ
mmetsp:Transcript_9977/g.36465  ORF Transcript_9977/g.36465 Transcript_9977/m.36465 type:complete len:646 (+) Transcript_9977:187-2124(+)